MWLFNVLWELGSVWQIQCLLYLLYYTFMYINTRMDYMTWYFEFSIGWVIHYTLYPLIKMSHDAQAGCAQTGNVIMRTRMRRSRSWQLWTRWLLYTEWSLRWLDLIHLQPLNPHYFLLKQTEMGILSLLFASIRKLQWIQILCGVTFMPIPL